MDFLKSGHWRLLLVLASASWLFLLLREIYRYRLLITKWGRLSAFIATLMVFLFLGTIITMIFTTGVISAIGTFVFFLLLSSLILGVNKRKIDMIIHPESVAKYEYEQQMYSTIISNVLERHEVKELIERYGRSTEFLRDLLERLLRLGNTIGIERACSFKYLQMVLELYTREDWNEEDKFIAVSNLLEYGRSSYIS